MTGSAIGKPVAGSWACAPRGARVRGEIGGSNRQFGRALRLWPTPCCGLSRAGFCCGATTCLVRENDREDDLQGVRGRRESERCRHTREELAGCTRTLDIAPEPATHPVDRRRLAKNDAAHDATSGDGKNGARATSCVSALTRRAPQAYPRLPNEVLASDARRLHRCAQHRRARDEDAPARRVGGVACTWAPRRPRSRIEARRSGPRTTPRR